MQSLNPNGQYNVGLKSDSAYLIIIGKYDTTTSSSYDGKNISVYVATTTTVRTYLHKLVDNSGVSLSLTNLLMSITVPDDGYVRRLHVVRLHQ